MQQYNISVGKPEKVKIRNKKRINSKSLQKKNTVNPHVSQQTRKWSLVFAQVLCTVATNTLKTHKFTKRD
jgi:hypothetical protein